MLSLGSQTGARTARTVPRSWAPLLTVPFLLGTCQNHDLNSPAPLVRAPLKVETPNPVLNESAGVLG